MNGAAAAERPIPSELRLTTLKVKPSALAIIPIRGSISPHAGRIAAVVVRFVLPVLSRVA
jgi:hypothetical protein